MLSSAHLLSIFIALNVGTVLSIMFPFASALTIPHPFKLILSPILIFLMIQTFFSELKERIKDYAVPTYNQKDYPKNLTTDITPTISTVAFTKEMKKLGGVVQYDNFLNNVVVSEAFLSEFISMPQPILNVSKGQDSTNNYSNLELLHHHRLIKSANIIGDMFSSKYYQNVIEDDIIDFDRFMGVYIKNCAVQVNFDTIKIQDVNEFLEFTLFEIGLQRIFGKKLSNDPESKKLITSLVQVGFMSKKSSNAVVWKIINCYKQYQYNQKIGKLAKIIDTELKTNSVFQLPNRKCNDAISMIIRNRKRFGTLDMVSISLSLMKMFTSMIIIPPARILNSLIYISSHPDRVINLIQEQKKLAKRYGPSVTVASIKKSRYLDVFVKESLLLSSPASYLHRKLEKDLVLSNGNVVPKGYLLSLNLFSKYCYYGKDGFSNRMFNPAIHVEKKKQLKDFGVLNIVFGIGRRQCPFTRYALIQIKIVVAILLRKYYILSQLNSTPTSNDTAAAQHEECENNSAYTQISTVVPTTSTIYLKKFS